MKQIACVVAIAWATAAHADGIGVIAVSATDRGPAAIAPAMAAAVQPGVSRVVDDAVGEARTAIAEGAVPLTVVERFRRVRELIDDGWRAFVRVQVELAGSRLAVARTEAESLVVYPGGEVLYADASLRLGAVLAHQGRTDDAHAALALALALDPDRPITLAEFSPDVVAAIDAVRAQQRPTRTLSITSEPPGASITIDGKEVGRGPATVSLGQHVIVARLAGYEPRALAVATTASSPGVTLELTRDAARSSIAAGATVGLPDAATHLLVATTLQYADLDEVVLVADTGRRGGPAVLAQRCAGAPARCTAIVEVGYSDHSGRAAGAREAWDAIRTAELRYPPSLFSDRRLTDQPIDDTCRLCRNPIVWGSVGAAALIGTIVLIAVLSGSDAPPTVAVDPSRF